VARIDLNADVGEGASAEAGLLAVVTSASVACGAHAGDGERMRATVRAACDAGVVVGAHPGYPDREGFGRRELGASPADIERWVAEQLDALREVCRGEGVTLAYVKAHGALYHRAVDDAGAAEAIVAAIARVDRALAVLTLPGSALLAAARAAGLATAREAFLDRAYRSDGSLVPRDVPGALITDPDAAADRALLVARRDEADSLCVHGDSPDALSIARAAARRLRDAGVEIAPFTRGSR
jgi:UPF0271 protein